MSKTELTVDDILDSRFTEDVETNRHTTPSPNIDVYNTEWMDAFIDDPENPNHILHNGEVLCSVDRERLIVPTKMGRHVRHTLLHPDSSMNTDDRYCQNCLHKFHESHDFIFDEDDIHCPKCGSQAKAVISIPTGIKKCDRCGYNVSDK